MSITVAKHEIQKYILSYLTYHRTARFSDLQPPKVKTNLFSYHLKLLISNDFVKHDSDGYTLTPLGLSYIDRLSEDGDYTYQQPKMITMFVIQNTDGEILFQRRKKQPYIDMWTLPNGKLFLDEESLYQAAQREIEKNFGIYKSAITQVGDCYIRVYDNDAPISVTFAHIFSFISDDIGDREGSIWVHPRKLDAISIAPAIEQILARTFFRDPFFFEEFIHDINPTANGLLLEPSHR